VTSPEVNTTTAPYDLRHALAVASRVDGLEAKLVALLHDAVEDGACGFPDLYDADLPTEVVRAVEQLTRGITESYGDYIARLKATEDDLAIYVKLADLDANLARLDEEHASLEGRWRKALQTLEAVS
jgi:(p)ppGpp synthase/HD superfamily hydrolase